jgi:hypothetical protein
MSYHNTLSGWNDSNLAPYLASHHHLHDRDYLLWPASVRVSSLLLSQLGRGVHQHFQQVPHTQHKQQQQQR